MQAEARIDPLQPQADEFKAWIDRWGNIELIDDQKSERMHPAFSRAAGVRTYEQPDGNYFCWLL